MSVYAIGETAPRLVAPVKSQLSKAALFAIIYTLWTVVPPHMKCRESPTCAALDRAATAAASDPKPANHGT